MILALNLICKNSHLACHGLHPNGSIREHGASLKEISYTKQVCMKGVFGYFTVGILALVNAWKVNNIFLFHGFVTSVGRIGSTAKYRIVDIVCRIFDILPGGSHAY